MMITFGILIGAIIFAACIRSVTNQLRSIAVESFSLTKCILHPVGFHLRSRLKKIKNEVFQQSLLLAGTLLGLTFLLCGCFAMTNSSSLQIITFLTIFVVSAVYVVHEIYLKIKTTIKYQRSLNSEIETAQCLDNVKLMGAHIFHDVPINKGLSKIDHVVVSEQGVFAVETKAWKKIKKTDFQVAYNGSTLKFPFAATETPINDAIFHAHSLNQLILNTTGEEVLVKAVVSLPGWSVLPMPQHPAHANCTTLNPKNFHYLMQEAKTLSAQQVDKIIEQLGVACNDLNANPLSKSKNLSNFEFKINTHSKIFQNFAQNYYNF